MPTVTNTIKRPDGTAATDAIVLVQLVGDNARPVNGYVTASDYSIHGTYRPTVNSTTAVWSMTLVANSLISPAGTVYKVTENVDGVTATYYISVPNGAGPYFVEDILDEAPGSVASSALTNHLNDTSSVHAASSLSFAADTALTVQAASSSDTRSGRIVFETESPVYPEAPWVLMVANAGVDKHDHVFHHLYNCMWSDAGQTWTRIVDNEHAIRYGFEARFDGNLNPGVNRGLCEWNLDINPATTGGLTFPKRPWAFSYDMDTLGARFQFGDQADQERNTFVMFGAVSEVTSLAMKTATDVAFLQITSNDTTTNIDAQGLDLYLNAVSGGDTHINFGGGSGGLVWVYANIEATANINVTGKIKWNNASNVQTTVGAAGGAAALPATPTKYLKVLDDTGATLVIPAYAAS